MRKYILSILLAFFLLRAGAQRTEIDEIVPLAKNLRASEKETSGFLSINIAPWLLTLGRI